MELLLVHAAVVLTTVAAVGITAWRLNRRLEREFREWLRECEKRLDLEGWKGPPAASPKRRRTMWGDE